MRTLHTISSTTSSVVSPKRLLSLERMGSYEKALREIAENWDAPTFLPVTADLSESDAAEAQLRFAALLGFQGHNFQVAGSQERSRDILTNAQERFLRLGNQEKAWECENYLALSYWRRGEYNEASAWIESVLAEMPPTVSDTRLYALVIRSLIFLSQKRYAENIRACESLAPDFFRFGNAFLTGSFCTNIGLSFKNSSLLNDATQYLELARDYLGAARHKSYLGMVENNLAQLYKSSGRFSKAHLAIDHAARAFRQASDRSREGFALDTKAQIYIAEREYSLALKTADAAIKILRKGENAAYLTETLQTRSRTQLFLNDVSGSLTSLLEAVEIARVKTGQSAADEIFEEFRNAANERSEERSKANEPAQSGQVRDNLQLVLPNSLAGFDDYQGLWINNSHLQSLGLTKGSLAVMVQDKIKRGDLVAISEVDTDLVSCGFYDEDFGIVCLEGIDTEPQLFDAAGIKILGKIVGVCSGKDESGKMIVEPVSR
ncbi:MAG TPA: hypothetical protein VK468_07645 [Pyrinomonadaceae bacterium]|nr:hypothetical protein [Pyrinomonadaceae bacterium]